MPDDERHFKQAMAKGLVNAECGRLQEGVSRKQGKYHRRSYQPGTVAALGLPAGVVLSVLRYLV